MMETLHIFSVENASNQPHVATEYCLGLHESVGRWSSEKFLSCPMSQCQNRAHLDVNPALLALSDPFSRLQMGSPRELLFSKLYRARVKCNEYVGDAKK